MIPIYILGGLKSIHLMPHVCIYLYNGSYPHPTPVTANTTTGFRGGWYHRPPHPHPRARGRPTRKMGGNGPGSTKIPVLILSYCQVHTFPCRAPPPRGQGTYPG